MTTFNKESMAELVVLLDIKPHAEDIDSEGAHQHAISQAKAEKNFAITQAKKHRSAGYRKPTLGFCAEMDSDTRRVLLSIARRSHK